MANEVIEYNTHEGDSISLSLADVKNLINPYVTDQEALLFLQQCKALKANPFMRDIHLIKYSKTQKDPASIVVGKDFYLKTAQTHPKYGGYKAGVIVINKDNPELIKREGSFLSENEKLVGGWCEVFRSDWEHPAVSELPFNEVAQYKYDGTLRATWKKMPARMTRKCAIVEAHREAFPELFGGSYTEDEMPVDQEKIERGPINVTPKAEPEQVPEKPRLKINPSQEIKLSKEELIKGIHDKLKAADDIQTSQIFSAMEVMTTQENVKDVSGLSEEQLIELLDQVGDIVETN